MEDLESLRKRIADVDAQIAELIARRLELAEMVAETKRESGLPIVDPQVEAKVIQRYRDAAERYSIGADSMESIARMLISEAIAREKKVI